MTSRFDEPGALATIVVEAAETTVTAVVHGELDLSNAEDVQHRLLTAAAGAEELRVSLTGLSFVDSSAMAALIALRRDLTARGARLTIVATRECFAARVLALSGLDRVLTVVDD